jgi:hypothetical protein
MRRVLATILLVLFSSTLVEPAVFAEKVSQLPECCRRAGQHHCAPAASAEQPASPDSQIGEKCPYSPALRAMPANGKVTAPGAARTPLALLPSEASTLARTEARCSDCLDRAHQKRGPPVRIS